MFKDARLSGLGKHKLTDNNMQQLFIYNLIINLLAVILSAGYDIISGIAKLFMGLISTKHRTSGVYKAVQGILIWPS